MDISSPDPLSDVAVLDVALSAQQLVVFLPIATSVVLAARLVIGVKTVGTFAPALLGLTVLQLGWVGTASALLVAGGAAAIVLPLLGGLRLSPSSRLTVVVSTIVLALVAVGLADDSGSALPIIVLAILFERTDEQVRADGPVAAVRSLLATMSVAAASALAIIALQPITSDAPWVLIAAAGVGPHRGRRRGGEPRRRLLPRPAHDRTEAVRPRPPPLRRTRSGTMSVLGLNRRNAHIAAANGRREIRRAKDKVATKLALSEAGLPVPTTIEVIADRVDLRRCAPHRWGPSWVMKPVNGSRGRGVLVVEPDRHTLGGWTTPSGRAIDASAAVRHAREIVEGRHSGRDDDRALVEEIVRPPDDLADLAPSGLPDVRIVSDRGRPLMAMLRLPSSGSDGRGNLHQGGIGAAVDLATGRIGRAVSGGHEVEVHPDTGAPIVGRTLPDWGRMLELAVGCHDASGLGYLGVDLVPDRERGPLVLEVNSHPGLEIQNIARRPLRIA